MRIAVYNHFWVTGGGGEVEALLTARALTGLGPVELWTPPGVDFEHLGERLSIDVSGLQPHEVSFDGFADASAQTADYDLFVNLTHATEVACRARHGIVFVHFPLPPGRDLGPLGRRMAARAATRIRPTQVEPVLWRRGFHPPEGQPPGFRWTDGDAEILVWPPRQPTEVTVLLGGDRPDPTTVTLTVDGTPEATAEVAAGAGTAARLSVPVAGRADGRPIRLGIHSGVFSPAEQWGSPDTRRLGVQVLGVRLARPPVPARMGRRSATLRAVGGLGWIESYNRVVVHSGYCSKWMRRRWHRSAEVIHPPAVMRRPGPKVDAIVSVGRFFAAHRGHSKRQHEMIRAFSALHAAEPGRWTLHLVGGCESEDAGYLEDARRLASGLPVHFHVDASGSLLDELYATSRFYWHAAGLGEDERRHPERFEHFGIAVVEAMSAGAVPIVFGAAGPAETVRDGIDGLHVFSLDGYVEATRRLSRDPVQQDRLRASAMVRAESFTSEVFSRRVTAMVDDVLAH